jgi:phage baseplate assembly protein V
MITMRDIGQIVDRLIVPLRNQVANSIARAVVNVVDNAQPMQRIQADAEETIADIEHFQPYGFSSVPGPDAEAVIVCSGGDRGKAMAVVVSEQQSRPSGQVDGEVTVYHRNGHRINFLDSGDIEITCRPGQKIYLNDGAGGAPLATKADVQQVRDDLHKHEHTYLAPPLGGAPTLTTLGPSVTSPTGTQVVRGE